MISVLLLLHMPFLYHCRIVLVSKKWYRLAQCGSLQARITLTSVSDIFVHILRFDLTNSVSLWLLFTTTTMTTPSQDIDVALA